MKKLRKVYSSVGDSNWKSWILGDVSRSIEVHLPDEAYYVPSYRLYVDFLKEQNILFEKNTFYAFDSEESYEGFIVCNGDTSGYEEVSEEEFLKRLESYKFNKKFEELIK